MNWQLGNQTIAMAIHILSNILISKGSQITKFGQLIEYNMINIFLKKLYKNCRVFVETIHRHFSQKSKLTISLDQ